MRISEPGHRLSGRDKRHKDDLSRGVISPGIRLQVFGDQGPLRWWQEWREPRARTHGKVLKGHDPGLAQPWDSEKARGEGGAEGDGCKGRPGSHGTHFSPESDQKPWKVRYLVTFSCWKKQI